MSHDDQAPSIDSSVEHLRVGDRHYTNTPTTFIKRQFRGDEIRYRTDGSIAEHPFNHERIVNERDALTFINKHTTIPVLRVLEWTDIDGIGCLTIERLKGRHWLHVYQDLNPEDQEKMKDILFIFVDYTLTPQLNQLRSKTMSQLSGAVFPPPHVSYYDQRSWESRTSSTDRYVYCHNDLAFHNLFVDLETLEIEAVIDWEYSGFFPPELEFPFYELGKEASLDEDQCRKMIALLEAPGDPPPSSIP